MATEEKVDKKTTDVTEYGAPLELPDVSAQELEDRIADVNQQLEQEQRWQKLRRKAMKLENLKLANRAPRCTHMKSSGEYCRAPAMGSRLFCTFHSRALEEADAPRIRVPVLADRQSIQLTIKQIMEQLIWQRITPQAASALLRAAYIALATVKSKPTKLRQAKAVPKKKVSPDDETGIDAYERFENMTDEELDEGIERLDKEIAELRAALAAAPEEPRKRRGNPEEKSG